MDVLQKEYLGQVGGGFTFAPFVIGCIVSGVSYVVSHRKHDDFNAQGFAMATVGGGVSTCFGGFGVAGRGLQVITAANTVLAIEIHEANGS